MARQDPPANHAHPAGSAGTHLGNVHSGNTHSGNTSLGQPAPETATERLDRLAQAAAVAWTGGLSPVSLSLAAADWSWHLTLSPGRMWELWSHAWQCLGQLASPLGEQMSLCGTRDEDPRFRHEAWTRPPFDRIRCGFAHLEQFWRDAASTPGMSAHHAEMTQFFARQVLDWLSPANWPVSNPVLQQDLVESQGQHLIQGWRHLLEDLAGGTTAPPGTAPVGRKDGGETSSAELPVLGRDLACTPGRLVHRNRLMELICYTPRQDRVHPEPVLIVPSWIMKYYILDLEPRNSLVRYLLDQGLQVFMISWHNPTEEDAELRLDDYLHLGVLDALQAIQRLKQTDGGVHLMGYCLGGTLAALAAAALQRRSADAAPARALMQHTDLPPLVSLSLLAAQTDFTEPGELGLFIDESQILFMDRLSRARGYLSGRRMAGSFQFLHSRELFWTRRMRSYLMGQREPPSALSAWNADTTRLPARMHHEYLTALYLRNALASGRYRVDRHVVSLNDIQVPIFLLATERDHISPWHSVYKLHRLCDAAIDFVLVSGGHNVGVLAEPGHPKSSYRRAHRPQGQPWLAPEVWLQHAVHQDGSWWPAWAAWLAERSSPPRALPSPVSRLGTDLGPAPGCYVLER